MSASDNGTAKLGKELRTGYLLNLSKAKAKTKKTAAGSVSQNDADVSSFMKLPPELRNHIYRYVLGGNIIHFIVMPLQKGRPKMRHVICSIPGFYHDAALSGLVYGADTEHGCCWAATRNSSQRKLCLSILLTCRQVYSEAALLPFSENIFEIRSAEHLQLLSMTLMAEQKKAIKSIILETMTFETWEWRRDDLRYLTGVDTLMAFIWFNFKRSSHEFGVDYGFDKLFARAGLYLEKVTVVLVNWDKGMMERDGGPAAVVAGQQWAQGLKKQLLENDPTTSFIKPIYCILAELTH